MSNMLIRTRLVNGPDMWRVYLDPISAPPKKIGPITCPVSFKFFFDPPSSIPMTGRVGPVRPPDPLTFILYIYIYFFMFIKTFILYIYNIFNIRGEYETGPIGPITRSGPKN